MSKASKVAIQSLPRLHYLANINTFKSKPFVSNSNTFSTSSLFPSSSIFSSNGFSNFTSLRRQISSKSYFDPLCLKFNALGLPCISRRSYFSLLRNYSPLKHVPKAFSSKCLAFVKPRLFSSGAKHFSEVNNGSFARKIFRKQVGALNSAFARYREAAILQLEGFWKRNYVFLLGAGGVVVCALLWRVMFGIADSVVGFSEGMAEYGFLALSLAMVGFGGLYIRSRLTVNPDKVYRMAMRRLNTSAEVLEVMGAPLSGSELRAYVMSGGGLTLKKFKPGLRSKRCFLIFPVQGPERRGLASVEVKKKKGQYDIKLLAVDMPATSGRDQRLYLIGDEEEYRVGGGLISELRDPIVKAMSAAKEFEDLDHIEDEEDAAREREKAERKRQEEMEKHEKSGQQ